MAPRPGFELAVGARLRGERVRWSSHRGRFDWAIDRDGWFRTAIELLGTPPDAVEELAFDMPASAGQALARVRRLPPGSRVLLEITRRRGLDRVPVVLVQFSRVGPAV